MAKIKVTFLPHNREAWAEEGVPLIRVAMEAGVHINASCGGEGLCGKCRVLVEKGSVETGKTERLRREDVEAGYVLACQARVKTDVVVRVPVESGADASVLNAEASPRRTARIKEIDLEQLKEQGLFVPPVEKKYLEIPEPTSRDNVCDMSRLVNHLRLGHDEHRLEVDLSVLRKVPDTLREQDFKVTLTLARPVRRECGRTRIINLQPGDTTDRNFALAIDVGTTTVYAQILDVIHGRVLAEYGDFNGQISFGEDVISRIVYAEKAGGLEKLHQAVIQTINKLIERLVRRSGVSPDEISTVALAGNTTMTQLLCKLNPRYIRRSPYVPAATLFPPFRGVDLGLEVAEHVTALVYPCISSYVGGDIVAGVMGSRMYRSEALTLYIDIGTNAEIVIGNKDWMACAACSAGPAFEGGGIEHGIRAMKGAIEDFSIDPNTLEPMNLTIGNVRPRGICGSGLIITVATLFEAGVLDSQGKFDRSLKTPRLRERDGVAEYVMAWAPETGIGRDIVLTEPDVDNLIRAKGAMYSGYVTLLGEVGLAVEDVERIVLAGGFGSYVDLEKAMAIGLLPEMDPDKVTFVGNGSLMGAKMSVLTNRIREDVVEVTKKMTSFELSETRSYMDNYVAALFLPHTNMDLFPKVIERLMQRNGARRAAARAL